MVSRMTADAPQQHVDVPLLADFGQFGGRYVAETLMPAVEELARAWPQAWADPTFVDEYRTILRDFVGRPTPLTEARRIHEAIGGGRIFFKREDLNHTGAHKINNCIGQVLLAKRLGKTRIIAETGAGQHGVATATACAFFGMPCTVYMGAEDVARQALNVVRMRLLGAEVRPVTSGSATLKDAINAALRDWVANVATTHYVIGSVMGPDPYPLMVRELQRVIGDEARAQILERVGRLPDAAVACVGGGSNAMGLFAAFVDDKDVQLFGVEATGEGLRSGRHAATIARGKVGVFHGMRSLVLQTEEGQLLEAHSISAGLDYPGIGPEHAHLHAIGRARYLGVSDREALAATEMLARMEGIIPALETAHAIAALPQIVRELGKDAIILVNLSGRGDKDMHTVMSHLDPAALELVREAERERAAARMAVRGAVVTPLPEEPEAQEDVVIVDGHELHAPHGASGAEEGA
jgi:tryptophan synthase beta chain